MVFTARICCCSATAASKIVSFVALIMTGWVCFNAWFNGQAIYVSIWESILLVFLMLACVMVFMACSRRNPRLMIPILIIQLVNFLSCIGDAIYYLIWGPSLYHWDTWDWIYEAGVYALVVIISGFILHCHTCCYKLLILKAHHHHHGGV